MMIRQKSKRLPVGGSNLSHFVAQMVKENVLNIPEVKNEENYVEKYYTLNDMLFRFSELD